MYAKINRLLFISFVVLAKSVSPREGYYLTPRRAQDSNLQACYSQLFSRQLPHHPDTRHISLAPAERLELPTFWFVARHSIPAELSGHIGQMFKV